MSQVVMQRLSDTMEEGTIIDWLVADGTAVAAGDELAEIQTDKAIAILVSDEDGVLQIREPSGVTVAVGHVIAELT
jgi:pyruvate dehydrogenase E2 component (dihydrolipoamide acetyltransferase)